MRLKVTPEFSDQEKLCSARLTIPSPPNFQNPSSAHWQMKLEQAQNVLFCKELFAHVSIRRLS